MNWAHGSFLIMQSNAAHWFALLLTHQQNRRQHENYPKWFVTLSPWPGSVV